MDVSGSQRVKAPRPHVFHALLDPEVLQKSVPGCDSAVFVDFPTGRQLKLTVSPNIPGLKGPYNVFLKIGSQSHTPAMDTVVLVAEPTSGIGSIKATCAIELTDETEGTHLRYNANATMDGKIAATPDIIVKGAVKVALDQFFKNFEKQISKITA